jgi:hypothetical protein
VSALDLAAAAVRRWTRWYSVGLPPSVRDGRLAELESDLWEHRAEARALGLGERGTAGAVLWRMVRGMPADLTWRLQLGGMAMTSTRGIERSSGLVMLLMVLLFAGGLSGPGIGSSEPYFTEDFPALVADRGDHLRAVVFQFLAAGAVIAAAWLLYVTFRTPSPAAARFGAIALATAGVLFLGAAVAAARLYLLADDWSSGGVPGDAAWRSAKTAAEIYSTLAFFGGFAFLASFGAFGMLFARRRVLPRPLGWLGLAGGALAILSLLVLGAGVSTGWYFMMLGLLVVFVAFALTAAWLVVRGVAHPEAQPPAL